jgi:hypothetical protein
VATAAGKTEVAANRVWGMRGAIGFLTVSHSLLLPKKYVFTESGKAV